MNGLGTMHDSGRRLASLDQGRFAASCYVMLFHASIEVGIRNPFFDYGFSGVQFFMLLSGYVLARPYLEAASPRPLDLRRYAMGRVTRILPPYYAVVILAALLAFLGHGSTLTFIPRAELGWHVLAHLLFAHTFFTATFFSLVSVLWSLGLEGQYYVCFPVLVRLYRRSPLVVFACTVLITFSTRSLLRTLIPSRGELENGFFLARLTEFSAGVMLAALLGRGWSKRSLLALAALLGGAGLLTVVAGSPDQEFAVQGAVLIAFVLLRLYGPATARSPLARGLRFLGEASYSTYLVHTIGGKAAWTVLSHVPFAASHPGIRFASYVLAGQTAGVLFYFAVERPATRWAVLALGSGPRPTAESARLT